MNALPVSPSRRGQAVALRAPTAPRLNRGDYEFLPAALEILETPLSPLRSTLTFTFCGLVVACLAWSYFGRVDIIAAAQGKIQAVGRTKTIQPLETGKVFKLTIDNGARVKAGDILLELDPGDARADEAVISNELTATRAEVVRRQYALDAAMRRVNTQPAVPSWPQDLPTNLIDRERRVLDGDLAQLTSTVSALDGQAKQKTAEHTRLADTIAAQQMLVATLKQRVDMRTELYGRSAESKAAVIDAQEVYQTQLTSLAGQKGQLAESAVASLVAEREIEKAYTSFVADNAQKLAEAERKVSDDERRLEKARIKTSHLVLKSPIDGVVQGLAITTAGQVVSSGEQVMQVVPEDAPLEIECYLPNADAGFVKAGQTAEVKIDAFPFTDYGTVEATVMRISGDAIPQADADQREGNPIQPSKAATFGGSQRIQNLVYPVTLRLNAKDLKKDGTPIALSSGMGVTVEIKTGSRRIMSYVLSPLVETASTAMRER